MTLRNASGWQLILADLSLILFLVTVAALAGQPDAGDEPAAPEPARPDPSIAPAQALYRPVQGGPSIGQWLADQAADPRATLSVVALHREGEERQAWENARALANAARERGVAVRIVIQSASERDLYASLAYDTPR